LFSNVFNHLVLEVIVESGDKVKRIPAKSLSWDFLCLSQPPQSMEGARSSVKFHFDEYHTLIQAEIYENRSWFYNRSCLGKFTMPVFQAKQRSVQVWIDLEEPSDFNEADCSSQADSESAVLSDDEHSNFQMFAKHSAMHDHPLPASGHSQSNHRQVHYGLFEQHYDVIEREDLSDDGEHGRPLADDDAVDFDVKSDHSNSSTEIHPRGRSRIQSSSSNPSKSRSVPTSPKRGRTSSVKSSSSTLASSSSHVYVHSGPHSPSSSNSGIQSGGQISRPSSPPYSPPNVGSPVDSTSPREPYLLGKRKSVDIKSSKEIGMDSSWFNFLSTSPPSMNGSSDVVSAPSAVVARRTSKRVLLQLTMSPVTCSVQDFEILASISHGALNSPNELFLVKDKDSSQPWFMKIVSMISHRFDDAPPIWEGSKAAVAYSTTLGVPMPLHPFLVEQMTTFQTDNKLYLMMEWLGGGELFSVLRRTRHGRFDEHEALFYTAQLVLAMDHMHSYKMIYRDLKPENLLLSAEGHLKITQRTPPEHHWSGPRDFSIVTGHSMPEYLAPEILKGLPYGTKADSWSVGTILYHMLVGQAPFHHPNVHNLFAAIISDDVSYPAFLSVDVVNLLKGLLHRDVKKRFSLKQVKTHEWFEGLDWNKMLRKEYAPPLKPFRRQDLNFGTTPTRRRTPQRGQMQQQQQQQQQLLQPQQQAQPIQPLQHQARPPPLDLRALAIPPDP
jgi:serine/threonine protein kinase